MISPRTGRHARAHRSARVAVAFALAFGVLATPQLLSPTAAVADASTDASTGVGTVAKTVAKTGGATKADTDGANTADDDTARLSVVAGLHGVIKPGASLTVSASIDNRSEDPVDAGRITIEVNRTPLADATALGAWLDSGSASGTFATLGSDTSEDVPVSESSTVSVSVAASAIDDLAPGVYPLRGTLSTTPASTTVTSDVLTASSVLIVSDDAARQVTVLVPITATPANGALLTADELTALTAPEGALTAQLDGVAGTSAAIAIDPLIPAAIRALGTSAPQGATDWLDRLESLSNERFALQAGDADATVQARAELPELLAPLPLTPYLNAADFVQSASTPAPTSSPTATPSPTPEPTSAEPELPSYDELTALPGSQTGILWPLGDVQTADLATFDTYLDTDVTTVLPSTSLATAASALLDIDGHRVLAMESTVSATLSDAAAASDDATREDEIAAGLAQLTYAGAQTSLLVGLDRDETRSATALRETILSLSALTQPTTLTDLRSADPASSTIVGDPTDERAAALDSVLADEERLTSFASILDEPLVLLSPERLAILRLIGVGAAESYPAAVAGHRAATVKTLNAVGVQQPSPIQLFTAAAPLPVWVRNDLPWPVNVTLESRPSDARLDVRPRTEVLAQPASNTRVKVPVEARVGSGELSVHFALTSPTGVHIGADQTANVTVRAEWESIGLIVLGGIIGLLLVLGIIRTVVRRRKGRGTDAVAEPSATE